MELNHHRTGSGEPLVLIHGIGSRWQMWEPVMDALSAHHEVIALDLPGFGASPMPAPETPPGPDSLTTLVDGFLSSLGVASPHVAGNSLGGLIALQLARRGSVRSSTAISPAGFASPLEWAMSHWSLWLGVRSARLLSARVDRLLLRPGARKLALGQYVAHPERMSPADAAGSVRALAAAPWFDATLPSLRPRQLSGGDEIQVPVTVAWGEYDRLLLPRQARRAAAAVSRARMVTLRGCGHVPTYDDPGQVARVILETTRPRSSEEVSPGDPRPPGDPDR
ncbi:MAG TPA: alpha/beta fold hydrolase [Solirubrobacteraceae bacterium]|jgi:pimeloyl-ACP methyl ester carboxylesterase|nr:alpha/beta fold hydrolase [Solirubrobacteraceae bacterium]